MSDRDLANSLHKWLTQEMRYTPPKGSAIPTPDDLRGICRGRMVDVSKFILNHVYAVQTVKKVKGNLSLQNKKLHKKYKSTGSESPDTERLDALEERRATLSRKISQIMSDNRHMDKDIKRLEREITETEKSYHGGREDIRNAQRRADLMKVFHKNTRETTAQYKEFKNRLDGKVQAIVTKNSLDTAAFVRGSSDNKQAGLEAASAHQVRETCANIGAFLHETLQGSFAGNKKSFNERKQGLWNQVETTLSDLSVRQVIQALVSTTQQSALTLRDKTQAINIKMDAEKLRFKFERVGQLKDMSTSTPLLASVRHLLEESQLAHIHDFMMREKHVNATHRHQAELLSWQKKLDKLLSRTFTDRAGELQLAQKVVEAELELVKLRATLYALLDAKDRLQESIEKSQQAREQMHLAYKKIHDFQEIADSKQNLIRVLSKQNLNARSRLDSQQTEIQKYIQSSLSSHLVEIKATSNQLEGSVGKEVERVNSLVMAFLPHVYLDGATKVGVVNLSINQASHPSAVALREPLLKTLETLHFPPYKGSECVLTWCTELMAEMKQAEQLSQSIELADKRSKRQNQDGDVLEDIAAIIVPKVNELRSRVTEQDRKLVERLLPVLNKRLAKAGNGLSDCLKTQEALRNWWEQPAQSCAPWVKVGNMTLKEWLDKYKVLVTRLIQLQVRK